MEKGSDCMQGGGVLPHSGMDFLHYGRSSEEMSAQVFVKGPGVQ